MGEVISNRDASKKNWATAETTAAGFPGLDQVNAGSLQRIADAVEIMARRHTDLIDERDRYKKWYEAELTAKKSRDRTITSLKGAGTKRDNRIRQLEAEIAALRRRAAQG